MDRVVQREVQTPCEYCGAPVVQPGGQRRLRRYCSQSHRQRAYEVRTAMSRYHADLRAGRVRAEPAERVIERTIQPKHPSTTEAWVDALAALAEQLHAGAIPAWDRPRIRAALAAVRDELREPDAPAAAAVEPVPAAVDDPVVAWLASVGAAGPTTLRRLAADLRADVEQLRAVLVDLAARGVVSLTRTAGAGVVPVDPDGIADHARFTLTVRRP